MPTTLADNSMIANSPAPTSSLLMFNPSFKSAPTLPSNPTVVNSSGARAQMDNVKTTLNNVTTTMGQQTAIKNQGKITTPDSGATAINDMTKTVGDLKNALTDPTKQPGYTDDEHKKIAAELNGGSSSATDTSGSTGTSDAASIQKNLENRQDAFMKISDQYASGSLPLTQDEQNQIQNLQGQFDRLITEQKTANQNLIGGTTQLGISTGINRYAADQAMGAIQQVTSDGLQKVADLTAKASAAIAELRQSFQDKDYKAANAAYQVYNDAMKERQQFITDTAKNAKEAADTAYTQVTKPINDIVAEAVKNGAPAEVVSKIKGAASVADAIQASVGYMVDPTSTAGQYNAYVTNTKSTGGSPMSAGDFLAAQKYADALATAKANSTYSYKNAYNAALAKANVDAAFAGGDKNQQKLEKDYSTTLLKELSNRSGGLGLQDQKVNQAIHLMALVNQYKDDKGNYNVPKAQYGELVLGLANLLSGAGAASEGTRNELMSKTASGDLKGALQYLTGTPQNGNSQQIIKNLVDSIDRQGNVAEDLRNQDVQFLHGLAPTDLDPARQAALEKNLLPSYKNPQQNVEAALSTIKNNVTNYYASAADSDVKLMDNKFTAMAQTLGRPLDYSEKEQIIEALGAQLSKPYQK